MPFQSDGFLAITDSSCGCSMCMGTTRVGVTEENDLTGAITSSAAIATPGIAALLPSGTPHWGSTALGAPATVTYSFMTAPPSYADPADRSGFASMNSAQQSAVRATLASWAEVANLTFIEVSDAGNGGVLRFGTNNQAGVSAAYAYYPGRFGTSGDVYLANDYSPNLNPASGTYGYLTLLHEIGHAIGLKHPGNYNAGGGGAEGPYLPVGEDNYQYTLMSYNSHPSLGTQGLATGPQLYDIAAVQYLYGANASTRSGNDVYSFNSTTTAVSRSIWDAGGIDTIDAREQVGNAVISLVAGTFSSIGPNGKGGLAVNNISIASGVMLENAIGGRGNDTLIGNHANNEFTGGAGNDVIHGGAGFDTAIYSGSRQSYAWSRSGDTITINGRDGLDTLYGVESLRFDDGSVTPGQDLAVFRFFNTAKGTHFYTSSVVERDAVIATLPQYQFEGQAFNASETGTSVWRFYNTTTGTHFYTISEAERDWVQAKIPTLRFEGEAYKASATPQEGLSALARFYNTQTGTHFYTANAAEAAAVEVTLPQFHREGTAYYVDLV